MTREEAQTLVTERLADLTANTAQWAAWARTLARFHHYSFQNTLLIWTQAPDATRVAGYKTWQALGRQVRKGEHGITIFAPMVSRTKKKTDATAESEDEASSNASIAPSTYISFRTATVFDIAQTDGDSLDIPEPTPLTGDALPGFLDTLVSVIDLPIQFTTLPDGTFGVWTPADGTIRITVNADPTQQIKTLLHEWSHALGVPDAEAAKTRHGGTEEVIAETTAMVVAGYCGLDTTAYSQAYVGGWAQGDPKQLQAVAGAVRDRVHTQIAALDAAVASHPELAQWIPQASPSSTPSAPPLAS
jgi:antirestriction protein ArdC